MTKIDKYGFVYIWRDRKHARYYVGCHWGTIDDGYICSSSWMNSSYKKRPEDFKRRILEKNLTRPEMYEVEKKWLSLLKSEEMKPKNPYPRYYNLNNKGNNLWHQDKDKVLTVGQKISLAKKGKPTRYIHVSKEDKAKAISAGKLAKRKHYDIEEFKNLLLTMTRQQLAEHYGIPKGKIVSLIRENNIDVMKLRFIPKPEIIKMTKDEQAKFTSIGLKNRWSDPVWKANQIEKLKIGSQNRWNNK